MSLMLICATALSFVGVNAEVRAHVNGRPSVPTNGTRVRTVVSGLAMDCNVTTSGHDAAWVEMPVNLSAFKTVALDRTISDSRQRVFIALTDSHGECHLFHFPAEGNGRQTVVVNVTDSNERPGERFAWRWGGDDNQRIDWPVKKIGLGINDTPDEFIGTVNVIFHRLEFK